MRKMSRIFALLVAQLLAAALILACGSAATDTGNAGAVATKGATPTAVVHSHFKVGQVVTVSGWNITVNSVSETDGSATGDLAPPAGDVYLVVDVTQKNVSAQAQDANLFDWNVRDATGTKAQLGTLINAADISGTVESGAQTHGQLVFEVPTGQHSFTLEYAPLFTLAAVWDISV